VKAKKRQRVDEEKRAKGGSPVTGGRRVQSRAVIPSSARRKKKSGFAKGDAESAFSEKGRGWLVGERRGVGVMQDRIGGKSTEGKGKKSGVGAPGPWKTRE